MTFLNLLLFSPQCVPLFPVTDSLSPLLAGKNRNHSFSVKELIGRAETQIDEMVYPKLQYRSATELAKPGALTPWQPSSQKISFSPLHSTPLQLAPAIKKTLIICF